MEKKRVYQQDPGLDLEIEGPDPKDTEDKALEVLATMIDGKRVYLEG